MRPINPLRHLHVRQQMFKYFQPYPHPDAFKRFIDHLIYVFTIIVPVMTLPQVYKIWFYQTAEGVSLVTWGVLFVNAFVWLSYGIVHKEKPLIILNICLIAINGAIVLGILLFANRLF